MGWSEVGQSSGGDFLKIEAGKKVRLHVLTEEPYTYKQVFFNDLNRGAILSDDTVGLIENKRDVRTQHAFWVQTEEGETKVWQMGNTLATQLKGIYDNYGTLADTDIIVARAGTGKDTKYICTPVPVKIDTSEVDVTALQPLEEVLVPSSADDIESMKSGVLPADDFNPAKLEKKAAPAEEETPAVEEETPVEEEETPPPPKKQTTAPVGAKPQDKMVVIRDIMKLLSSNAKYKNVQAKALLFKRCAPGKTTVAAMSLPELLKVRNELNKK